MATLTLPANRSWRAAFMLAALIEFALIGLAALILHLPSGGADNPLPFLAIGLVQFPSSMLAIWLMEVIPEEHGFTVQALFLYGLVMFVGQTLLLAVLIRKPWREL